jgi:DNA replication and repair protein RecF
MRLAELAIHNFRNYAEARLTFSPERNFIFGRNAQGKSNLLQAITLLCLTKDMRSAADDELVKTGEKFFEVSGTFVDERGLSAKAGIGFQKGGAKQIVHNGKRQQRQADYVGKFPIVVFSPESHRITGGSPSERRRFIDMLLCQGSPAYLADLQDYSRTLRQRNALLAAGNRSRDEQQLASWDERMAGAGASIVAFLKASMGTQ